MTSIPYQLHRKVNKAEPYIPYISVNITPYPGDICARFKWYTPHLVCGSYVDRHLSVRENVDVSAATVWTSIDLGLCMKTSLARLETLEPVRHVCQYHILICTIYAHIPSIMIARKITNS